MREFIEVTDSVTNCKVCLSMFNVLGVFADKTGGVFIHTYTNKNDKFLGVNVVETYSEIIALLQEC